MIRFTKTFVFVTMMAGLIQAGLANALPEESSVINKVTLVLSQEGRKDYGSYAELFAKHLKKRSPQVLVEQVTGGSEIVPKAADELVVRIGIAESDNAAAKGSPGPEGFIEEIAPFSGGRGYVCHLSAADRRGVLYGLGRLLLESRVDDHGMTLPFLSLQTAPRTEIRATNGSEKTPMDPAAARQTGARAWTPEEGIQYLEEQLLAGANQYIDGWGSAVFVSPKRYDAATSKGVNTGRSEMAQRYGVGYIISNSINGIGKEQMRPEWRALDHGTRHESNICVSVPEARQELLKLKGIFFKHAPRIDRIIFAASDVAGCGCDQCAPWSHTYYELVKDLSRLLKQYHPEAKAIVTNQDFSIEDNERMFSEIRNDSSSLIDGFCLAPGGNEALTYGGVIPNPRWKRYPGVFPRDAFLKSRLRYLRSGQELFSLVDISHWKRAGDAIPYIDPILAETYPRRTFNARPVGYSRIMTGAMTYGDGITGYSEGNFDDFNKFLLLRLAWDPDLTPEGITQEYYRYHCGEAAANLLAKAAVIGEENYQKPLLQNEQGIVGCYRLIAEAKNKIPRVLMERDWRYAMLAQRATVDLYLLRGEQRRREAYDRALAQLQKLQKGKLADAGLQGIKEQLSTSLRESEEMARLRAEARSLDDQTNRNGAIRSAALKNLEKQDGVGIRWFVSQIDKALEAGSPQRGEIVHAIVHYDTVAPGEFYDNCGTIDQQPHFVADSGELYYGTGGGRENARPSQRSYNYTFEKQEGLEFRYDGLDRSAQYEVVLLYPNPKGVSFAINSPNEFDVLANGTAIGRGVPSGEGFDRFAFPIPEELTKDGKLHLALRKVAGKARSTCISEVWIRKVPMK